MAVSSISLRRADYRSSLLSETILTAKGFLSVATELSGSLAYFPISNISVRFSIRIFRGYFIKMCFSNHTQDFFLSRAKEINLEELGSLIVDLLALSLELTAFPLSAFCHISKYRWNSFS